ncbi:MAG: ABC transporter permease [Alphaproteobacteria bacterium]|nr:ABC transporter permease [Alphaproteobacteria bacterium]
MLTNFIIQFLNGLSSASALFLVSAGLSIIFGVSRIVNFAHGSFFMLGSYLAYTLVEALPRGPLGFWGGVLVAGIAVALLGVVVEVLLLRRIYRAPELFQLLATFGLVLLIKDFTLWAWGPEDLLGPRAPGLKGAVTIAGRAFPEYDLALIAIGPAVLALLWLLLNKTRWGTLVRAATQDREMVGALGVNQARLFTGVFALGSFLAGLGGAIQIPREPANLFLDITVISDAFVVVVVGGLGSIPGAFLAALLISLLKALCIGIGDQVVFGASVAFSKLTLVVEFLVMAVVLVIRPYGLLGTAQATARAPSAEPVLDPPGRRLAYAGFVALALLALAPVVSDPYILVLLVEILCFALFAVALHALMGPAGMVSFGHAAYFGLGAYGAALLFKRAGLPMEAALLLAPLVAGAGGLLFGWFVVRLSGVYLAMLTLAFAQIAWSIVFQWDGFTGGSNGMIGIWPAAWLAPKPVYYLATLLLVGVGVWLVWRAIFSPFGYALRAGRDSPLRADAIGIDLRRLQWLAFAGSGALAGLAGALYVFSKGGVSPDAMSIPRSVDGLMMVLLGGVQTVTGGAVGAAVLTLLQDELVRRVAFWRAVMGAIIILLVVAFPEGLVGFLGRRFARTERT